SSAIWKNKLNRNKCYKKFEINRINKIIATIFQHGVSISTERKFTKYNCIKYIFLIVTRKMYIVRLSMDIVENRLQNGSGGGGRRII
ncbi:hypothetical protein NL362_27885, partial [Klebsiella pneumoniae]|nr:hypothetical protein [Klebsiella pneumoniae]